MIIFKKNFILSCIVLFSILSSYFIEYYLQIIPCFLCLITRQIFIILFFISFIYSILLYNKLYKEYYKIFNISIKLILIIILTITSYHLLIEYGILDAKCISNNLNNNEMLNLSIEEIKTNLFNNTTPPCNISYKIFGFSLVLVAFSLAFSLNIYYFLL
ncbi:MAG: disulfide bond formation protein B [Rickettsiales bacterium]